MARSDERERVRQRLDALDAAPVGRGRRLGGRWDLAELESDSAEFDDDDARPPTPHWLSEPAGTVSMWHERLVPERFRGTRLDPGRRGVLVLGAVGVAAVVLAAAAAQRDRPVAQPVPPLPAMHTTDITTSGAAEGAAPPVGATTSSAPPSNAPNELVVSVVGLVEHPGLLHLPPGSRVADAVSTAVARDGADLERLNLAQRLIDGDQIVVGALGPHPGPPQLGSMVLPGGPRPVPGTGHAASAGPMPGPAAKIDLNSASESDLDTLPGVGPSTARAIVAWRTEHGRFTSVDQLGEVQGIGPTRLQRLRDLVTV